MQLRYISLHMGFGAGYSKHYMSDFNYHCRFISNYLSVQIRKLKYETDGTFKMISVSPTLNPSSCRILSENVLKAFVLFDEEMYKAMNEQEKYKYYLTLLEEGYRKCSEYKTIPIDDLLKLHQQFRDGGYKNEWIHKKKRFKEYSLLVILECYFSALDFQLKITVNDLKTKSELISGVVARTRPDEVHFQPLFRDIAIQNEFLVITDFQDRPKFKFLLKDVFERKFCFEVTDVGLDYEPFVG